MKLLDTKFLAFMKGARYISVCIRFFYISYSQFTKLHLEDVYSIHWAPG